MIRVRFFVFVFVTYWIQVTPQQCRQVTVCDEANVKGQKGEVGFPGKRGSKGLKGDSGDAGDKGSKGNQGESCALGDFGDDLRNKLKELTVLLTPPSCETSPVYGKQTLRSGEEAFCDGGWTAIQRRFNGSVSFDRNWVDYKNGFGSFDGEFWLGLDKIHLLTKGRGCSVRFDLWSFDNDHAFALYRPYCSYDQAATQKCSVKCHGMPKISDFYIEDESDNYRLHIADYSGTAGDSMNNEQLLDKMMFSTKDRDNDENVGHNCATNIGGWWYRRCSLALLNNKWGVSGGNWQNIVWNEWKGSREALKKTVMKVRCV